jgi:ABC-type uncharacterized transport system permease subunit
MKNFNKLEKTVLDRFNKKEGFQKIYFTALIIIASISLAIGMYNISEYYSETSTHMNLKIGIPLSLIGMAMMIIYAFSKIVILTIDSFKIKKESNNSEFDIDDISTLKLNSEQKDFLLHAIRN